MVKLTLVAGTRPNFVKISPIIRAIKKVQAKGIDIFVSIGSYRSTL
jgi:UDP-N-acetylglucosamine 2-epimerase